MERFVVSVLDRLLAPLNLVLRRKSTLEALELELQELRSSRSSLPTYTMRKYRSNWIQRNLIAGKDRAYHATIAEVSGYIDATHRSYAELPLNEGRIVGELPGWLFAAFLEKYEGGTETSDKSVFTTEMSRDERSAMEATVTTAESGASSPSKDDKAYWSCDWLEGGLFFAGSSIKACCVHHSGRGVPSLIGQYSGGKFPIQEILDARMLIRRENQQPGRHEQCRDCQLLVHRNWPAKVYPIDIINFSHFIRCNLKCVYCLLHKPDFKPPPFQPNLLPMVEDIIRQGLLAPTAFIMWGGGEVSILPEFEEMFELLSRHGVSHYVASNAVLLSDTLLKWLPRGQIELIVSVDAGTRETYRAIKQVDAFDRVWKHLGIYAKAGREKVCAKIILTKRNVGEIPQFIERVVEAGITWVTADVDIFDPVLEPEVANAAGLLWLECLRRGIRFSPGAGGALSHPDNQFRRKALRSGRARLMALSLREQVLLAPPMLKKLKYYWQDKGPTYTLKLAVEVLKQAFSSQK